MLDLADKWEGWSEREELLVIRQKIERWALPPEPGLAARGCRHEAFTGTPKKPYHQDRQ